MTRNLQYYLDSRIYSSEEIQKSIDETKKDFPNKNIKVTLSLNDFGVYIITFKFENKNTLFDKIKIKFRKKLKKQILLEEYSSKPQYGKYKETKTYRPY